MNGQANSLKFAVEAKRKELIENLNNSSGNVLSDGRKLEQLTITELQDISRNVGSR